MVRRFDLTFAQALRVLVGLRDLEQKRTAVLLWLATIGPAFGLMVWQFQTCLARLG